MKTQIFSLIMGTALFATHPAFCMIEEPEEKTLCLLPREMQIYTFEKLDEIDIFSIQSVSSYYNDLIQGGKRNFTLNISYSYLCRSREESFKNACFSLKRGIDGDENKYIFVNKVNLCQSTTMIEGHSTLIPGEVKQEILFFPSQGRLKFLVKAETENIKDIPIVNRGYIKYPPTNTNDYRGPELLEIVKDSDFNMNINIHSELSGGYIFKSPKEEKKWITSIQVKEDT